MNSNITMSAIWSGVSSFLYSAFIDTIVFVLVDIIAKTLLKEIGGTDRERRLLWLAEFMVLVLSCVFLYAVDHFPWILASMALLTFVSTQLPPRLQVVHWWSRMKTHWDEHQYMQQHVESIQIMQENLALARQQQAQAALHPVPSPQPPVLYPQPSHPHGLGPPPPYPHSTLPPSPSPPFLREKSGPAVMGRAPVTRSSDNHWELSRPVSVSTGNVQTQPLLVLSPQQQQLRQRNPQRKQTMIPSPNTNLNHWYGGTELRRRPLHGNSDNGFEVKVTNGVSSTGIATQVTASMMSATSAIKSGLMSVMGLGGRPSSERLPAGMRNNNHNMCFVNATLQCLARTPHLISHLTNTGSRPNIEARTTDVAEPLLFANTVDLLAACRESVKEGRSLVLDAAMLRQVASALNADLFAPLGEHQMQQDSAEFLMWILSQLHNTLNKQGARGKAAGDKARFDSLALQSIKFIYGDLTPGKIEELKAACRREISLANALDNNSYAESIQRLCDLEWLTHKQANNTIIDDLFGGQLVEAYHCLTDNHITVMLQPFQILPVQIAAPRDGSKQVLLADCFTAYCNVEHMIGSEVPQCSWCADGGNVLENVEGSASNGRRMTRAGLAASTPKGPVNRTRASSDSAFLSPGSSASFVSPIVGPRDFNNDSGFLDNNHKTSTPIRGGQPSLAQMAARPGRVRDVQRRHLLRQLPECLIIHLLRFDFSRRSGRCKKIKAQVRLCLKNLDLTDVIYDNVTQQEDLTGSNPSYRYDLYAFCVHIGGESTNSGHYLAYCEAEPGKWFRFDDEIVTEVNIEYELGTREVMENAYVLFYRKVNS